MVNGQDLIPISPSSDKLEASQRKVHLLNATIEWRAWRDSNPHTQVLEAQWLNLRSDPLETQRRGDRIRTRESLRTGFGDQPN